MLIAKNETFSNLARFCSKEETFAHFVIEDPVEFTHLFQTIGSIIYKKHVNIEKYIFSLLHSKTLTLENLCNFLGWNGGTIWQAIYEIEKLNKKFNQ
jgi:hypothetical protein